MYIVSETDRKIALAVKSQPKYNNYHRRVEEFAQHWEKNNCQIVDGFKIKHNVSYTTAGK